MAYIDYNRQFLNFQIFVDYNRQFRKVELRHLQNQKLKVVLNKENSTSRKFLICENFLITFELVFTLRKINWYYNFAIFFNIDGFEFFAHYIPVFKLSF